MKRSRFSEEQIIGILSEHQAALGAKELCRTELRGRLKELSSERRRFGYPCMVVSDNGTELTS